MITSTAIFSIPNFVCGLSDFKCVLHIRPSSFNASLISRMRILQMKMRKERKGEAHRENKQLNICAPYKFVSKFILMKKRG